MLKYYATIDDLLLFLPVGRDQNYLKSISDYEFEDLVKYIENEMKLYLRQKGIDASQVMTPLYLHSTVSRDPIKITKSSNWVNDDYYYEGLKLNRLVTNITDYIPVIFMLYGTNRPSEADNNNYAEWNEVATIAYDDEVGQKSIVFDNEFKYYKIGISTSESVTFNAFLVETVFDYYLDLLAFAKICFDKARSATVDDEYYWKMQDTMSKFENAWSNFVYNVDIDNDDSIEDSEIGNSLIMTTTEISR